MSHHIALASRRRASRPPRSAAPRRLPLRSVVRYPVRVRRRNFTTARVAADAASASSSAADDAADDPYPGIDTNGVDLDEFERFVMSMQADFIADMEALDGSEDRKFGLDAWVRGEPGSGSGVTRVLEGGDVFEKAAANVQSASSPPSAPRPCPPGAGIASTPRGASRTAPRRSPWSSTPKVPDGPHVQGGRPGGSRWPGRPGSAGVRT